jgi:hypothetical protein
MQIIRLSSFPIEQEPDLAGLEWRLGAWFAARTYPVRLLAYSRRFNMRPAVDALGREIASVQALMQLVEPLLRTIDAWLAGDPGADPAQAMNRMAVVDQARLLALFADLPLVQQALASAAQGQLDRAAARALWSTVGEALAAIVWPLPWMKEQVRFYEALQQRYVRSTTYLLLTWEPPDVSAGQIAATLQSTLRRSVRVLDTLPAVLDGPYIEQPTRLKPETPGVPWLAALLAYDTRGVWDATTLHDLLDVTYDVALAIDILTLPRSKATRRVELAYAAARTLARESSIKDVRGERVLIDSELVMHELSQQGLHDVQIAVLVGGESAEELEVNVADMKDRLGSRLRLMRVAGVQGELLKFWSTTPSARIEAPLKRRNMLSHGVGCCAGILGYHRAGGTSGLLWGLDARRRAPLFFDLFADNQAAHMVILGKSGYGKTFFLNVTTLRAAALAGHTVVGIDAFRNGARIAAAAGAGARCNWIGLESTINILDVVYDAHTEGGWIPNQVQHVIGQLALLMGDPGRAANGREQYTPRTFTLGQRGVLDRALTDLYEQVDPGAPPEAMPILSDLIARLEQLDEVEATGLARDLRMVLYGTEDRTITRLNSLGRSFNGPTTVDWNFGRDINYFDFSAVPELLRPFYYAQAIGAINRYMRNPRRDLRRKTLLLIDEFGYAAQVEAVARLAADICKVARKYGIGLIVVDQNPITFLGSEHGRAIFENAAAKLLFHLDDLPARQMGEAISDLSEGHIEFLSHAGRGQCLGVFGNDVYVMNIESNPMELRALRGS